uniref:GST N-terminal domain-containing protein n=1 Tax=Acrobeloides nanus TaxID=290746 RepID=A0A914DJU4_9BILA
MVHYKLTYYDARNLGEPARLILKYANVPFEDDRLIKGTGWPARKSESSGHKTETKTEIRPLLGAQYPAPVGTSPVAAPAPVIRCFEGFGSFQSLSRG